MRVDIYHNLSWKQYVAREISRRSDINYAYMLESMRADLKKLSERMKAKFTQLGQIISDYRVYNEYIKKEPQEVTCYSFIRNSVYELDCIDDLLLLQFEHQDSRNILDAIEQISKDYPDSWFDPDFKNGPAYIVKTEPIRLQRRNFGVFDMVLILYPDFKKGMSPYDTATIAETPFSISAGNYSGIVHPHVLNEHICLGEHAVLAENFLRFGYLYEYFDICNRVLHSYNSDRPYARIDNWQAIMCGECNGVVQNNCYKCPTCYRVYCQLCLAECERCNGVACPHCSLNQRCVSCGKRVCRKCFRTCSHCSKGFCVSCYVNQRGLCKTCYHVK
jgi:hypothetical protein